MHAASLGAGGRKGDGAPPRPAAAFEALARILGASVFRSGQDYLETLVRSIAQVLGVRHVAIVRLEPEGWRGATLAMWSDGRIAANFAYDLAGTPCENVVDREVRVYPDRLQQRFPDDRALVDMGVESYVGAPTFDTAGRPLGLLAVLDDRPIAPADQPFLCELLTILAGVVSSELERQRVVAHLEESRQDVLAASQAKSRFLATMSHEVRTPLNGVLGCAAMLEETLLDAGQRELVDAIGHCGQALLSLIEDVLDLSRIEAGELRLAPAPFCFDDVLQDVLAAFRVQAAQQGVALELDEHGGDTRLLGDRVRIRQVLLNLVGNALKFTEQGRVAVRVRVEPRGGRQAFRVDVQDSGCGVPESLRESIFEPFVQVEDGASRRHGGAGLGLAISREIAVAMGGALRCDAAPDGDGALFTFEGTLDAAGRDSVEPQSPRRAGGLLRARVLLVEDSPVNRLVAGRMLQRLGCDVAVAADGSEAVARFSPEAFDLVLMDCQMPVLDGWAATAALRAAGHRTPIVALTAHAMSTDEEQCRAAGMDDFLPKPVTLAALRAIVERYWR